MSPSSDLFGFDATREAARVRRYFSGVLSPAIWQGYREAGVPMCVAITDMGPAALERVVAHASNGGQLLIDSGAYRYRSNPEAMPWTRVLAGYRAILEASCVPQAVILPDVVGDQDATLDVLRAYGPAVLALCGERHEALMPVQRGARELPEFLAAARDVLGAWPHGIAIPSAAAALDPRQLALLSRLPRECTRRVHILGVSRHAQRLMVRLVFLRDAWPDADVSRDACEHRAQVGEGRRITVARRAHLEDLVDDGLAGWDETEADCEAMEAWADTFAGGALDQDGIEDLLCSDWGRFQQLAHVRRQIANARGPQATTRSIRDFALAVHAGAAA